MKPDDHALRWDIVPFFHGNILDMSEGRGKCFPHFISYMEARVLEPSKLTVFADKSLDGVFSSYVLHLLPKDEVSATLMEWSRVVKAGGHFILHLPSERVSDAQKWDCSYESVVNEMEKLERDWDLVCYNVRPDDGGLLFSFKVQ